MKFVANCRSSCMRQHRGMTLILSLLLLGYGCSDTEPVADPTLSKTPYKAHVDFVEDNLYNYLPDHEKLKKAISDFQNEVVSKIYNNEVYIGNSKRGGYCATEFIDVYFKTSYIDDNHPSGVDFENESEFLELVKAGNYCSEAYYPALLVPTVAVYLGKWRVQADKPENRNWKYPDLPENLLTPGEESISFGITTIRGFKDLSSMKPVSVVFLHTIDNFYDEMWDWSKTLPPEEVTAPITELDRDKIANVVFGHELCHAFGLPEQHDMIDLCHDEDALGNSCRCILNYIPMGNFKHYDVYNAREEVKDLINNIQEYYLCPSCESKSDWVNKSVFQASTFSTCTP